MKKEEKTEVGFSKWDKFTYIYSTLCVVYELIYYGILCRWEVFVVYIWVAVLLLVCFILEKRILLKDKLLSLYKKNLEVAEKTISSYQNHREASDKYTRALEAQVEAQSLELNRLRGVSGK